MSEGFAMGNAYWPYTRSRREDFRWTNLDLFEIASPWGKVAVRSNRGAKVTRPDLSFVFLPSAVFSGTFFLPTAQRLSRLSRVYIPEVPRLGRRECLDYFYQWWQQFSVGRSILVAHSYGCQHAIEIAIHYPYLVDHLILISPVPGTGRSKIFSQLLQFSKNRMNENPLISYSIDRDYERLGWYRYLQALGRYSTYDFFERLRHISQSALILRGEKDQVLSGSSARSMTQALACGSLTTIPSAAHFLNFSHPHLVVREICEYLNIQAKATV